MKVLDSTGFTQLLTEIKNYFIRQSDTVEASTIDIDSTPTSSSTNLVTSGGVYTSLSTKLDSTVATATAHVTSGSSYVYLYRQGNMVTAYWLLPGSWSSGANTLSNEVIPSGYRPAYEFFSPSMRAWNGSTLSTATAEMNISSSTGRCILYVNGTVDSNWNFRGGSTWYTSDAWPS